MHDTCGHSFVCHLWVHTQDNTKYLLMTFVVTCICSNNYVLYNVSNISSVIVLYTIRLNEITINVYIIPTPILSEIL